MFLVQACSYKNKVDSNYYCQKLKFSCIQSNKIVNFKTTKGDFEVELFGKDNPVTVSNFLENIDNDIYVNQKFYKIINFSQIRFIHGGVKPENNFDIEFQDIPGWQIKSVVVNTYGNYEDREKFGIRVIRNDC